MRHISAFIIICGLALASPVGAVVPQCTAEQTTDLPSPGIAWVGATSPLPAMLAKHGVIKALFDLPVIQYPYGSRSRYGFQLTYVVGVDGKVACATLSPSYGDTQPVMTEQRARFLEQMEAWRFEPFLLDGKPSAVTERYEINEEELPQTHVAPPPGDPAGVVITQEERPEMASFGPYHVELHGDGTAIYLSLDPDDPLGPQSYHVDPKAVQALVARAGAADFWSLRDVYPDAPGSLGDAPDYVRTNITLGGSSKSLTHHWGQETGMPEKARALSGAVMSAAQIEMWQVPTLATVEQLKANAYNFHAGYAGRLLLRMVQHPNVKDDAVLAVMALGAPQDAEGDNPYTEEYEDLLEASLATGRTAIASQLISKGALQTNGADDHDNIDWAFRAALRSGSPAVVDLMLTYHPSLTYGPDDKPISVIRLLGKARGDEKDIEAVAQRLLDLGADINARDSDGRTLLYDVHDQALKAFLIAHGADVNVMDGQQITPLAQTFDEDMALMLLDHGADPRLGKSGKALRFNIKNNHWTRVKAWLQAHGFADLLTSRDGENES